MLYGYFAATLHSHRVTEATHKAQLQPEPARVTASQRRSVWASALRRARLPLHRTDVTVNLPAQAATATITTLARDCDDRVLVTPCAES